MKAENSRRKRNFNFTAATLLTVSLLIGLFYLGPLSGSEGEKQKLIFSTGFTQGTYHQMGRTLNYLPDFQFELLESSGSLQNIGNILQNRADIAITQLDVFFDEIAKNPSVADKIKIILPLYAEEVHLLASKKISKLRDIKNIKINIGPAGSGSQVTAKNLIKTLGFQDRNFSFDESPTPDALQALLQQKIDMQVIITGAPLSLLEELSVSQTNHIQLLPILQKERKKLLAPGMPYRDNIIRQHLYPWLKETIRTVSVDSVIIAKASLDEKTIDTLIQSIFKYKLELFLSHRKWKDLRVETIKKYLDNLGKFFHSQVAKSLVSIK